MKTMLIVGLGNILVGDDGIGCRVAEHLAADRAFTRRVECIVGGSDLLRLSDQLERRKRVVLIDAVLSDAPPGTVEVYDEPFDALSPGWVHAHHPSAVQAIRLLKATSPSMRRVAFTIVGIAVHDLRHEETLSVRLPEITEMVRAAVMSMGRRPVSKSVGAVRHRAYR